MATATRVDPLSFLSDQINDLKQKSDFLAQSLIRLTRPFRSDLPALIARVKHLKAGPEQYREAEAALQIPWLPGKERIELWTTSRAAVLMDDVSEGGTAIGARNDCGTATQWHARLHGMGAGIDAQQFARPKRLFDQHAPGVHKGPAITPEAVP